MKYAYAAWRKDGFSFAPDFEASSSPEGFTEAFAEYAGEHFQMCHTLLAQPPGRDLMPVGMVFSIVPFFGSKVYIATTIHWFPWASPRNKLEATVHFLNQVRKDAVAIGLVGMADVPFLEHVCRYGVSRRVGNIFDMITEGPTAVFQTRKPYLGKGK